MTILETTHTQIEYPEMKIVSPEDQIINSLGGSAAIAEMFNIGPLREADILKTNVYRIVQNRLQSVIVSSSDVQQIANRATEARISKGDFLADSTAAEVFRTQAALSTARKMVSKFIPAEYSTDAEEEAQQWYDFVSSGSYDTLVAEVRRDWKHIKEEYLSQNGSVTDSNIELHFFTILCERINYGLELPFGEIGIDDMKLMSNLIPAFNLNSEVQQFIAGALAEDATLLSQPLETIMYSLDQRRLRQSQVDVSLSASPAIIRKKEDQKSGDKKYIDRWGSNWAELRDSLISEPLINGLYLFNIPEIKKGQIIRAAVELCPLYAMGSLADSSLMPALQASIEGSRVSKKWLATRKLVENLSIHLAHSGRTLEMDFNYADWGVLAGKNASRDTEALRAHEQLYFDEVQRLCDRLKVNYRFQRFSDIAAPETQRFNLGQFAIAENSQIITEIPTGLEPLLEIFRIQKDDLDISGNAAEKRAQRVLTELLKNSDGNVELARGLLLSYTIALPHIIHDADMHIGMERSQTLLELPVLSVVSKKPTVSVLVS